MLFISHGIGSVAFYLDRKNSNSTGFSAIGDFDYSYSDLFSAYSYLFIFLLFMLLFVALFRKKYHTNFLPKFLKKQYDSIHIYTAWNLLPIIIVTFSFTMISIWMYNLHIGMIGLQQTELPFRLTGILFYMRRFVFPLVLIWIFMKTNNKFIATFLLITYSFIVGITSTSKSASLLMLLPLATINYLTGRRSLAFVSIISAILAYFIVGQMRLLIYTFDADIDLLTVISSPMDLEFDNLFLYIISNITGRLYGLQSTVLTNQYDQLTFTDLIDFYSISHISEIIPDMAYELFGMNLPDDKAFGVGVGFTGAIHLFSCHNYIYTILQAFIVSVIFCVMNDSIQTIIVRKISVWYKYVSILILLLSFLLFYDGNSMFGVYCSMLLLLLIRFLVQPKMIYNRV